MNQDNYLKILGLERGASLNQIKKAYRLKASIYHPDRNKRENATDIFIAVNEAYEFLCEQARAEKKRSEKEEELINAWKDYRREQAKKRAYTNSRVRYSEFTKSKVYRTSMILNKAQIIASLSVSVFITIMAIVGYIEGLRMVKEGYDPPRVIDFIFLLSIGCIFFMVSLAHLLAYYKNRKKTFTNEKAK